MLQNGNPTDAKKKHSILIVDDESVIRDSLVEYLEDDYLVDSAISGVNALEILTDNQFDLMISDINMSPMNGIELISQTTKKYPAMKTALITGYRIEDYIKLIRKHRISNVIAKTAPFDFNELERTIENILFPETVFGLKRYLEGKLDFYTDTINSRKTKQESSDRIITFFQNKCGFADNRLYDLKLVMEEIINNAIFHAYLNPDGSPKYVRKDFTTMEPGDGVEIEYGRSKVNSGFSVTDFGGCLPLEVILEKLHRQMSLEGLADERGRGIFISRILTHRMIINIKEGEKTQFVVIFIPEDSGPHKSLAINLVD